MDVLTIVLFLTALILRFLPYHSTFDAARVVYAVNFITFFFRILHIFSVHRELGPKLVMIGNMVSLIKVVFKIFLSICSKLALIVDEFKFESYMSEDF